MKSFVMKVVLVCAVGVVASCGLAAEAKSPAQTKPVKSTGWAAKMEQMVQAMMPQEKLDKMTGFFAPVVKKYMPVFNQFQGEYQTAAKKLPVVMKYLPKADSALAEAKAMKVPERYEQEKAEYISEIETLLSMTKMSAKLANKLAK